MRRVANVLIAATCLVPVLASGCSRRRAAPGAVDLPAAFVPIEWASGAGQSPAAGAPGYEGCATRLRDQRDGTILLLRRSENRQETVREGGTVVTRYRATGDYEVLTPGRYGLSAERWLRVDCATWRPVGPVPRAS